MPDTKSPKLDVVTFYVDYRDRLQRPKLPIIDIKPKHSLLSYRDDEPVVEIVFPMETLKELYERLPSIIDNKRK